MDTLSLLRIVVPVLYVVTLYLYLLDFRGTLKEKSPVPTIFLVLSVIFHIFFWASIYYITGIFPIGNLYGTLTTFVLLFAVVYMFIELGVKDRSFGIFVLTLIVLLQSIASFFISTGGFHSPLLEEVIFEIHVISLIISYSAFSLGVIAAIMHILLSKKIKNQDLNIVYYRLPTLQFLQQVILIATYFGFGFLTAGLALGFYNTSQVTRTVISLIDPKIISAVITWLVYGYLVSLHLLKRLTDKKTVYLSIIGFGTILFTFFAVSAFMDTFHLFE